MESQAQKPWKKLLLPIWIRKVNQGQQAQAGKMRHWRGVRMQRKLIFSASKSGQTEAAKKLALEFSFDELQASPLQSIAAGCEPNQGSVDSGQIFSQWAAQFQDLRAAALLQRYMASASLEYLYIAISLEKVPSSWRRPCVEQSNLALFCADMLALSSFWSMGVKITWKVLKCVLLAGSRNMKHRQECIQMPTVSNQQILYMYPNWRNFQGRSCFAWSTTSLHLQCRQDCCTPLLHTSPAADGLNFDHAYSTCFAFVEGGTAPSILWGLCLVRQ